VYCTTSLISLTCSSALATRSGSWFALFDDGRLILTVEALANTPSNEATDERANDDEQERRQEIDTGQGLIGNEKGKAGNQE
jgi:hypothetical protein